MKAYIRFFVLLGMFFFTSEHAFSKDKPVPETAPNPNTAQDVDQALRDEVRWLQAEAYVYTASKREQGIKNAPSVMTVYTAEDIKRQGLRSLKEVLERTVGFFSNKSAANPLIGNRGIISGENEHFLLLIDGQNMNSIVDQGPGDYDLFPLISHVKRIEIIRGPGSTMWGGDAAMGVIHIITKDGKDINGFQVNVDAATEDRYQFVNVQYGDHKDDDHDVMLSFTFAEADGYPKEGSSFGFYPYPPEELDDPDLARKSGPLGRLEDSWELYAKAKQGEYTLTARASDLKDIRMDDLWALADGNPHLAKYNKRRDYSINVTRKKEYNKNTSLEARVFTKMIEKSQYFTNPLISRNVKFVEESYASKETAIGFELMFKTLLFERHNLLSGIKFVQTEIDPVYQYDISDLDTTPWIAPPDENHNILVIPDDEDENYAAYIEDDWQVLDNLNLILGLRVDRNTLREKSTKVLPRAGVIWGINSEWTAKYLFNTGYVRPPVAKSFLGQYPVITEFDWITWTFVDFAQTGVQESEEVKTHDLQLSYNTQDTQASLTGYRVVVDNAFNGLLTTQKIDPTHGFLVFYANADEIISHGIEFDFRQKVNDMFDWYGNYSYVCNAKLDNFENIVHDAKYEITPGDVKYTDLEITFEKSHFVTDDGTITQIPHKTWNLGMDFLFKDSLSAKTVILNLHYRGWDEMWGENPGMPDTYEKLDSEHYVDVNFLLEDFLINRFDVSVYVKNLFDNDSWNNTLPWYGYWPDRGQSFGFKVSYIF